MRSFWFLIGHLRAITHVLRDHTVVERSINGRLRSIYCNECHIFLWVRT